MKIEIVDSTLVQKKIEKHYKVNVNDKEVWVSWYIDYDENNQDNDIEIFKGKELLSEKEEEKVIKFIETFGE